ncbi:MAG: primosomal protein N' [Candidatus Margulisbacteria bacterium]|nr:primosomal protein N' [Candidatus Margulisiibacteriota bacterium]
MNPILTLTKEQEKALEVARKNRITLIHGVTASGKTEIYLRRVADTVAAGKQAIVLVPEISLTPQTIERFASKFKTTVLHSRLTPKERFESWNKIINGEVTVVVGARSAVFAPFPNLGLIVIDEEHDSSYKQDNQPRYHTREVAIQRSNLSGAQVILGSATPSLETFYLFKQNQAGFAYVEMKQRIDNFPLPPVELIDMRQELQEKNRSVLSRELRTSIKYCLSKGEQVILLLNRRGFSSFLLCRECGATITCPRCHVTLTYHNDQNLKCHYCNHVQSSSTTCPKCSSIYFKYLGSGTQKAESELKQFFRDIKILRMDKDTTKKRGAHQDILEKFKQCEGQILLGTQMIAKGLDFPNVTLVGVLNADTALHLPDFRSAERTFQLMTQVAGRSGRGLKGGKVIIQTYNPEHYALQAAKDHDYQKFYAEEIQYRQALKYPPFSHLTCLIVSSTNNNRAQQHAENIVKEIKSPQVLGPAPAPIYKLRNRYRWQILIKDTEIPANILEAPSGIQVDIDVDPINLL